MNFAGQPDGCFDTAANPLLRWSARADSPAQV